MINVGGKAICTTLPAMLVGICCSPTFLSTTIASLSLQDRDKID